MVKSPCVGKCTYDITIQICSDCHRTKEEISTWYVMTDEEKLAVLDRLNNAKIESLQLQLHTTLTNRNLRTYDGKQEE